LYEYIVPKIIPNASEETDTQIQKAEWWLQGCRGLRKSGVVQRV
jgi:hypothetical protein